MRQLVSIAIMAYVAAAAVPTLADPPAGPASAKPLAVGDVFTVRSILGIAPAPDRVRLGESGDWNMAFGKCRAAFGDKAPKGPQPALRVGEPRQTKSQDREGSATVEVVTLEMDFQCGLPAKAAASGK